MPPRKSDGANVPPTRPDPADTAVVKVLMEKSLMMVSVGKDSLARRVLRVS